MLEQVIVPKKSLSEWSSHYTSDNSTDAIIQVLLDRLEKNGRDIFFKPSLKDIPAPDTLKDIEKGVELFISHILNGSKIVVVGDYDVDGVTSTALFIRFLLKLGYTNFDYFLPNRFAHGYGLTETTVGLLLEKNPDLIITVDNGITAKGEIQMLKESGVEVIVTDHHQPQDGFLPDCVTVNPKQEECKYPFNNLSGVGVIFLFLVAVRTRLREKAFWEDKKDEPNLLEDLDLVALGTVADQVPLTGVNRIFVKYGLKQMNQKVQGSDSNQLNSYLKVYWEKNNLSSYSCDTITYRLAPLLNSAGRMEDAGLSLKFILSEDETAAALNYGALEKLNQKRRKKQQVMLGKAVKSAEGLAKDHSGLFVYNPSFHEGLLGIIASQLTNQFHLPSIVATDGENNILKASCRSSDVNILDVLKTCEDYLSSFGGHNKAAGCCIIKDSVEEFGEAFHLACKEKMKDIQPNVVHADLEVKLEMLTGDLHEKMKIFEPYGQENKKPVFMVSDVSLPEPVIMMKKHLKWMVSENIELIYWDGISKVVTGKNYDLACVMSENVYMGEKKYQVIIKAVSPRKIQG